MKGIILAAGTGSRLRPLSLVHNKHLLPLYNKPVVFYPLATLISLGITEVLIITNPEHGDSFRRLLSDGTQLGITIRYAAQDEPRGLPDAFRIGEDFIAGNPVALILGDNIFWGPAWRGHSKVGREVTKGALVFTRHVADPSLFGILTRDDSGVPCAIEEKPENPRSFEAIPGLYFFGPEVVTDAKTLAPSARGELEICDLLRIYLDRKALRCRALGGSELGVEWFDAGTPDNLLQAASLISGAEHQGSLIGSPEFAAYQQGRIDSKQLLQLADGLKNTLYGRNLTKLATASGKSSREKRL
jgi:glucose-1-phosphate thymidylyltransferase